MRHIIYAIIFTVSLLAISVSEGFPTPIPKPKHSFEEAYKIALKQHERDGFRGGHDNTHFPQMITFTTFNHSSYLRDNFGDHTERGRSEDWRWIRKEWGWIVTIVTYHDLSQTDTYFVRQSGEAILIGATD